MRTSWRRLARSEKGATAVEYGLIVALLVMAMLAGMTGLGTRIGSLWGNMANSVVNT